MKCKFDAQDLLKTIFAFVKTRCGKTIKILSSSSNTFFNTLFTLTFLLA
jgi:hypothetical protein